MKKVKTLTFATQNVTQQLLKGEFKPTHLPPKKGMQSMRLKFSVPITNNNASPQTPAAADKLAILNAFRFRLTSGAKDKQAFNILGSRLRVWMRKWLGCEVALYADTTTGLGQTIPNGQTKTCAFWLEIPFVPYSRLPASIAKLFAMGPTQAQTLTLTVDRLADPALSNNLTIANNSITVDIYPGRMRDTKADGHIPVPEVREPTEINFSHEEPDGVCFDFDEETAALASTAITQSTIAINGKSVHELMAPADAYRDQADYLTLGSIQDTSDTYTPLYTVPVETDLAEIPPGPLHFENPPKNLASYAFFWAGLPVVKPEDVMADAEYYSREVVKRPLKIVSHAKKHGIEVPDEWAAYMPMIVVTDEDRLVFERYHGIGVLVPGGQADVYFAPHELEAAQKQVAKAKSAGKHGLADAILQKFAHGIPGAADGARGTLGSQNLVMTAIRQNLGHLA